MSLSDQEKFFVWKGAVQDLLGIYGEVKGTTKPDDIESVYKIADRIIYDASSLSDAIARKMIDIENIKELLSEEIIAELKEEAACKEDPEMPTTINEWAEAVYENAVAKGWWDIDVRFSETAANLHREISEAFEAFRNGEELFYIKDGKPEGIAVELIDCWFFMIGYLKRHHVDIEHVAKTKYEYNLTRPYRHGGKMA
ncbi:MAG: hypothetical protein ACRDBM_00960 [Sporomusa sp.]